MAGERSNKSSDGAFGFYLACFLVFLVLLGAAVLLLPVWRDYKSKEKELFHLRAEIAKLKAERNARLEQIAALENTPGAVEKVAREKFNLVRPGDTVLEYQHPGKPAAGK